MRFHLIDDILNLLSDPSQIPVLGIRVNVKDPLHIVVTYDDRRSRALDGSNITQELRLSAVGRGDRSPIDVGGRIDHVLRRLYRNAVTHSILRVQPEVRCGLSATA